jgi:hypothetical protein
VVKAHKVTAAQDSTAVLVVVRLITAPVELGLQIKVSQAARDHRKEVLVVAVLVL